MKTYKVFFINAAPVTVNATNRADAIRQAIERTRGHLSKASQKLNFVSACQS